MREKEMCDKHSLTSESSFIFLMFILVSACASSSSSVNFHDRHIYGDYGIDYNSENSVPIKSTIETEDEPAPIKSGHDSFLPHRLINKTTDVMHSSATGIVIAHNGYVLTNYHVVDQDPVLIQVMVGQNGKLASPATIVAEDRMNDLAVIKISYHFKNIAHFSPSENVKINQIVYYWGYPYGLSSHSAGKCFHRGYVSRLNVHNGFFSKAGLPRFYMGIRGAPGVSGSGIYSEDGYIVGIMQGYVAGGQHHVMIPTYQVINFLTKNHIPFSI